MDQLGSSSCTNKSVVFDPKYTIPREIVDDVICRFLLNIPREEKFDPIRVCFQIELAHWFFVDYYCGEGCDSSVAHLHNIPYNQFAFIMFQQTPHLKSRLKEIDKHLTAFRDYKMRVPTYGAILMDANLKKVVLVQGFRNQWGFPKGKVNEVEEPLSCAIREVFEETGYDIAPLVNRHHFIESKTFERNDRLYLVRGVDVNFSFQPQTQFEIKNIRWFNIDELPEHKRDGNPAIARHGVPVSNFYTVYPYVKRLRAWIADKHEGKHKIHNFKVRPESETVVDQTFSNQRNPNKAPQHQFPKTSNPLNIFHQQLMAESAAGWQLFPGGGGDHSQHVLNSNAIHELILGTSQFQNPSSGHMADKKHLNATGKGVKNPRRRLFSDEYSGNGNQVNDTHLKTLTNNAFTAPPLLPIGKKKGGTPPKSNTVRDQFLNAPSWVNFTFHKQRIFKAFYSPDL